MFSAEFSQRWSPAPPPHHGAYELLKDDAARLLGDADRVVDVVEEVAACARPRDWLSGKGRITSRQRRRKVSALVSIQQEAGVGSIAAPGAYSMTTAMCVSVRSALRKAIT